MKDNHFRFPQCLTTERHFRFPIYPVCSVISYRLIRLLDRSRTHVGYIGSSNRNQGNCPKNCRMRDKFLPPLGGRYPRCGHRPSLFRARTSRIVAWWRHEVQAPGGSIAAPDLSPRPGPCCTDTPARNNREWVSYDIIEQFTVALCRL